MFVVSHYSCLFVLGIQFDSCTPKDPGSEEVLHRTASMKLRLSRYSQVSSSSSFINVGSCRIKSNALHAKESVSVHCYVTHCTVIYCSVLYCTVLYYIVVYCIVLYCTILYTTLYFIVLFCTCIVM